MPYFIEKNNPDCSGWAVVDQGGDIFGCHTTKQAAIDQAVAISIADDEPFEGERHIRNLNGNPIVVSDIDDTLISGGRRVDRVWDYVDDAEGAVFILTGRPESTRDETVRELNELDIEYSRLIMNDGSTADSPEFKARAMERLLETYNVIVAVENDADTRRKFSRLGVTVVNPADIEVQVDAIDDDADGRSSKEREVRTAHGTIEVREDGDGMTFEGYAAVFNSPSEPLPFVEKIERGAFSRSLRSRNDIKLLWNHDTSQVLGSTRAKTLTLVEDDRGLKVRGILPNTTAGRDAAELLKRGDVDAMSFGFTVIKDAWSSDGSERTLKSVRLHEVSIVAFPAYTGTAGTTSVRNLDRVAERAQVDADALSAALEKVEAGEDITAAERDLLSSVLDKLGPEEVADVEETVGDLGLLALKKKKLELLENS